MLPAESYKVMQPIGDFSFVVAGVRGGKLVEAPNHYYEIKTPTDYNDITYHEALSKLTLNFELPEEMLEVITPGAWRPLEGWKYIHWLDAGAPEKRLSVFFRPCRQVINSAANFDKGKNLTDLECTGDSILPKKFYHEYHKKSSATLTDEHKVLKKFYEDYHNNIS